MPRSAIPVRWNSAQLRAATVAFWLLCAAAGELIIFFGGTWSYFREIAELLTAGAVVVMCASTRSPGARRQPLYLCGILAVISGLQLVPLPRFLLGKCAPHLAIVLGGLSAYGIRTNEWHSLSYASLVTQREYLWLLTCLAAFLIARAAAYQRLRVRSAGVALVVLATMISVYGLYESTRLFPRLLWLHKRYYLGDITGTFVNRNHFAGFIELVLPVLVAFILIQVLCWRRTVGQRSSGLLIGAVIAAGILCAAVIGSHSRSGLTIAAASVVVVVAAFLRSHNKRVAFVLLPIAVISAALIYNLGIAQLQNRFAQVDKAGTLETGGRLANWHAILPMLKSDPLLGTGLGTFAQASLPYQVVGYFDHAHNDYLEFACDAGIPFALVLFGGLAALLVGLIAAGSTKIARLQYQSHGSGSAILLLGAAGAVFAILLHSATDFNLHIPANAYLLSIFAGLGAGTLELHQAGEHLQVVVPSKSQLGAYRQWARIAVCTSALIAAVSMANAAIARGRAEGAESLTATSADPHTAELIEDGRSDLSVLRAAIAVEPLNAELWSEYSQELAGHDANAAAHAAERAAQIWPHSAEMNVRAATAFAIAGSRERELAYLRQAVLADSNDSTLTFETAESLGIDTAEMLQAVVAPAALPNYLEYQFRYRRDLESAHNVWLVCRRQSVALPKPLIADYANALRDAGRADELLDVWPAWTGVRLATGEIWNGDLRRTFSNTGFDWEIGDGDGFTVRQQDGAGRAGPAFAVDFDGTRNADFRYLRHLLPIERNTTYTLRIHERVEDLTGDSGVFWTVEDAAGTRQLAASAPELGTIGWHTVELQFRSQLQGCCVRFVMHRYYSSGLNPLVRGRVCVDGAELRTVIASRRH